MEIVNSTNGAVVAEHVRLASNFFARLKGLLGTARLAEGEGLIIRPCNGVHTLGMRYRLDILFVDNNQVIRKIVENMRVGRMANCFAATYVVELPAGQVAKTGTEVGHHLVIS